MGVQGLNSYIESNKDVLKNCHFRNSKLIIDGSNLFYSLYFNSYLDQAHGGDYELFEELVSKFFRNLKLCEIKPYVVLDGGADTTGKKNDTLLKRSENRIKKANALSQGRSEQVLPILTKNVFKQVLQKLGIPFVQCLAEADWEVAALANEWKCPVLSHDSDFYIFNIKEGFLPMSHFHWRKVTKSKKCIQAKLFKVKNLCAAFNRLNCDLLPIFATILGNDYTKLNKNMFPAWLSSPTPANSSVTSPAVARINSLLTSLSFFPNPKAAIQALVSTVPNTKHSRTVHVALNQGLQEYRLAASSIKKFFITGDPQIWTQGPLQHLPEWMLKPLAEGKLNSIIIDVLMLQKLMLNFPVEDSRLPSSNQTSRHIRQVIYGLLLATKQRDPGEPGLYGVEEYDRQDLKLTSIRVAAILPRCAATHLHLDTLWETPRHLRLQVLLDTLRVLQQPELLSVPANLQLAVYVTCYWLKNARPEPKAELYWALLLGLVYGELSRERRTAEEVGPVLNRLKNLQTYKDQRTLNLEAAHAFSQWQCCLRDGVCLNQLLHHPVPEPECAWLYSGTLVHQAASKLKINSNPESLLAGGPYPLKLFQQLRRAVEHELNDNLARRMRPQWVCNESEDDLIRMIEHLMSEEDSGKGNCCSERGRKGKAGNHDDELYEYPCSIRTRHKTKRRTRNRDPKAKKRDRVCFD